MEIIHKSTWKQRFENQGLLEEKIDSTHNMRKEEHSYLDERVSSTPALWSWALISMLFLEGPRKLYIEGNEFFV